MRKLVRLFSILAVLCSGGLSASHIQPGGWEVSADFLWLMPTLDDTYFVIDAPIATAFPTGERRNNDFDFHPGFRVDVGFGFCDCDRYAKIDYAWLGAKENTTFSGPFLWATIGRPDVISGFEAFAGSASSELNFLYERIDAYVGQRVYDCCGLNVDLNFGLEFVYLRLRENYEYVEALTVPIIAEIAQRSRTWGVGPQFGVDLYWEIYQMCGCSPGTLSVHIGSSGSILASRTDTRNFQTLQGAVLLDTHDEDTWRLLPALHAKVGLSYDTNLFSCYETSFEVGYEFNSYLRGLSRTIWPDNVADGLVYTNYYNFDVQGLYVSLAVGF